MGVTEKVTVTDVRAAVESASAIAVPIAEREGHRPMLLVFVDDGTCVPIDLTGLVRARGMLSRAAHGICAIIRPRVACVVSEAWGMVLDVPSDIERLSQVEGIAQVPDAFRKELLILYAEDCTGAWAAREYAIRAREPGGVLLTAEMGSHNPGDEQKGEMRGFVPRREVGA